MGKIKRKGVYEYVLSYHQNHSMLVVPKAAEAKLVHGIEVEDFILSHEDRYDFMLRTKVPKSSRLIGVDKDGNETPLQNTIRYYISKSGLELVKIMPPLPDKDEERRMGINKGNTVIVCNDIRDYRGDIDYSFYIEQANKLVDPLLGS